MLSNSTHVLRAGRLYNVLNTHTGHALSNTAGNEAFIYAVINRSYREGSGPYRITYQDDLSYEVPVEEIVYNLRRHYRPIKNNR